MAVPNGLTAIFIHAMDGRGGYFTRGNGLAVSGSHGRAVDADGRTGPIFLARSSRFGRISKERVAVVEVANSGEGVLVLNGVSAALVAVSRPRYSRSHGLNYSSRASYASCSTGPTVMHRVSQSDWCGSSLMASSLASCLVSLVAGKVASSVSLIAPIVRMPNGSCGNCPDRFSSCICRGSKPQSYVMHFLNASI